MKSLKSGEPSTEVRCSACGGTGFPTVAQPAQAGRRIYPLPSVLWQGSRKAGVTTSAHAVPPANSRRGLIWASRHGSVRNRVVVRRLAALRSPRPPRPDDGEQSGVCLRVPCLPQPLCTAKATFQQAGKSLPCTLTSGSSGSSSLRPIAMQRWSPSGLQTVSHLGRGSHVVHFFWVGR